MALRTGLRGLRGMRAAVVLLSVLMVAGCDDTLTDENYELVTVGMSYSEVESILGAGTREDSGGYGMTSAGVPTGNDSGDSKQQTYTWEEDGKKVVIVFNNGSVLSKSKLGW